jgi:hypothetical protein
MWPRMPASVLWKIGRVASSAFAALKASPRPQIALAQHDLESGDFGVGAQHEQAAQALDHWQQQRHVGGIGGHQEGGDRRVGLIEHDAKHDLLQMPAVVFGMPVLAQVLAAGSPRITMTSCR